RLRILVDEAEIVSLVGDLHLRHRGGGGNRLCVGGDACAEEGRGGDAAQRDAQNLALHVAASREPRKLMRESARGRSLLRRRIAETGVFRNETARARPSPNRAGTQRFAGLSW